MKIKKIRGNLNFLKNSSTEFSINSNDNTFTKEDIFIQFDQKTYHDAILGTIEIDIKNGYFKENLYLETLNPINLFLRIDELPTHITSLYLFSEWWTRPSFSSSLKEIPDRTQVALFKFKNHYGCFLPLVGDFFKASLKDGTENEIGLEMTALVSGINKVKEPVFLYAESYSIYEAISKVFKALSSLKGVKLKEDRRFPDIFRYLGWCSWDAVYRDVDEKTIRDKTDEFIQKEIPVNWIIIDDGWSEVNDELLYDFTPDKIKFPNGFKQLTEDIKSNSSINNIGVWHALGGYWNGIDPESPLAKNEKDYLYKTAYGKLLPSPVNGGKFYSKWYKYLNSEGIDFVKVDNQSLFPLYFENSMPIAQAARGLNEALEEGASYLDNNIINCMGMAMENIVARPSSSISRNSDDFFPMKEGSFTEHLLQNAYNSLYHNELYVADWDIFWTSHPQNIKHSLLRAISGGPIYFSDKIGETNKEVLKPLIYTNGEILLMNRSAKPTEDSIFIDPLKDGVLKLQNIANYGPELLGGGIALFNLSNQNQDYSLKPSDIPEFSYDKKYWIYNYFTKENILLNRDEDLSGSLGVDEFTWFVVLPKVGINTPLGLLDKYIGFTSVEEFIQTGDLQTFIIKESGPVGWLSEKSPKKVLINNIDVTDQVINEANLYKINWKESEEKLVLTIIN